VKNVRDLDGRLAALGLRPDMTGLRFRVRSADGSLPNLVDTPDGGAAPPIEAGEVWVTTGRQAVVDGRRFVEVKTLPDWVPDDKLAPETPPPSEPAAEPEQVAAESDSTEPKSAPEAAPRHVAWAPLDDVSLEPAVRDPVGLKLRVRQPLYIRTSPGVQHERVVPAPLARGTEVSVIGPVQRDWWRVRVDDSGIEGCVSSLWLDLEEK